MRVVRRFFRWLTFVIAVAALLCCALGSIHTFSGLIHTFSGLIHTFSELTPYDLCSMKNAKKYPREGIGRRVSLSREFYPNGLKSLCTGKNLTAIVPINSAIKSFERREAIRKALGGACAVYNCKTLFLVAGSFDEKVMTILKEEIVTYGDVLMVEKEDTYQNINNKLVAMLEWLVMYCARAKYVIFMNDDTFVNFELFFKELEAVGGEYCNCIVGYTVRYAFVKRNMNNSHYIPTEKYHCAFYPKYAFGAAYAFPNVVTSSLLTGVYDAPHVWPDDVWLTGLVRHHVNVNIYQCKNEVWLSQTDSFQPYNYESFLFVHNITGNRLIEAYDYILGGDKYKAVALNELYLRISLLCVCVVCLVTISCKILHTGQFHHPDIDHNSPNGTIATSSTILNPGY